MNNKKRVFSAAEIEVIRLEETDVIATSGAPILMAYQLFSNNSALNIGGNTKGNYWQ